jgi:thymidine phosphorylase
MDVKFGSGAFAAEFETAAELAESIVTVAGAAGLPTTALLTDMNQVLGRAAGNAVEVREAIDHLTGTARNPRLHEVTVALAAELLVASELAAQPEVARAMIETTLASGAAAERFARMVRVLGGPADLVEHPDKRLPRAAVQRAVPTPHPGVVEAIDARGLGLAVMALGGGRRRADDAIDHAVGLTHVLGIGEASDRDTPLAVVHAQSEADAGAAAKAVTEAIAVGEAHVDPGPVVRKRVAATG